MMLKPGVQFEPITPVTKVEAGRMDIACFIGFIPMRLNVTLPATIEKWLKDQRWHFRVDTHAKGGVLLKNIPIPIESWSMFIDLFEPGKRLDGVAELVGTALPFNITVEQDDAKLYVVVDDEPAEAIDLTPGIVTLPDLVDEINLQLQNASIKMMPAGIENQYFLMVSRKNPYTTGSINVFQNKSLGFVHSNVDKNGYVYTYLGAAVSAFFQQGGKKCYVIPMGDPLPLGASVNEKINRLASLLFADSQHWDSIKTFEDLNAIALPDWVTGEEEQSRWHSLAILLSLTEVTFLSFPDLPDLLSVQELLPDKTLVNSHQSDFVECVTETALEQFSQVAVWQAPRCHVSGYQVWSKIIKTITKYLAKNLTEVQLIASIPLPANSIKQGWESFFQQTYFNASPHSLLQTLNSDQLQLTYPWLKTSQSTLLPSGAELPEGRLIGLLANSALQRGSYFSVAGTLLNDVYDLYPATQNGMMQTDFENRYLVERVSFYYPTVAGISLQSDVTPANTKEKQYAVIKRLTMYIRRMAKQVGMNAVFEPNSANLWEQIKRSLEQLMTSIYQQQVLKGKTSQEAFNIICDRTTMTLADQNNGRVITQIMFQPALPVEKIIVSLAFDQKGQTQVAELGS